MSRSAMLTGALLIAAGLGVFLWRTVALRMPIVPSDPQGLWQVELEMTVRGDGGRGSIRASLPSSGEGQIVFGERAASDRLLFSIRSASDARTGVWSGPLRGVHHIRYDFRVQLEEVASPLPGRAGERPPADIRADYGGASVNLPSDAVEVRDLLEGLDLPPARDPAGRLRALFAFGTDEVATVEDATDDALLTLAQREGSPTGKARLLVTLLRAAGFPARTVFGLALRESGATQPEAWVEAWADGQWIPMSPSEGFFASRPAHLLVLRVGDGPLVEATGARALDWRYHALRERLRPEELATVMAPGSSGLARFSLYRLPIPTQLALRTLLILPLGALVVSLFRNVVGLLPFGTFMPILIALAMRATDLSTGLVLVGGVLVFGVVGRVLLNRLRLLLVPRLSVLLCLVVLAVTGIAATGHRFQMNELVAGVLYPIVILTMLIERFSIAMEEEGLRPALAKSAASVVIAVASYPIFRSTAAQDLMFGFPELVVVVMGSLVMVGGYTGYRLSDLLRFRLLTASAEAPR